jgi:hypothetical protein
MKHFYFYIVLLFFLSGALWAQTLDYQIETGIQFEEEARTADVTGAVWEILNARFLFEYKWFSLFSELGLTNEGKYEASENQWTGDYYMIPGENYLQIDYNPFLFQIGRLDARSNINTPYSLHLTSQDLTSIGANFTFDWGPLFYNSRWIQLNYRSEHSYPEGIDRGNPENIYWQDKGANHKTFGVNLKNFRFGWQETNVYIGRSFDLEYFVSPLTQYLTQLFRTHAGKPWSEQANDNTVMGPFVEYMPEYWYAYGQLLIDDVNASFLPGVDVKNLTKMAWSTGVSWNSPIGEWSLFHAGATKYTFEATYADSNSYSIIPYSYTYFPAVEFPIRGSVLKTLWYYDNYLGYKYGENNLAFQLSYQNTFLKKKPGEFNLNADLEWVLNGSKSPANPWHEYTSWKEIDPHVELLTDGVVEHILRLRLRASKNIWKLKVVLDLEFGYVWNGLDLEIIAPDEPKRFVPQEGNNFPIIAAGIRCVLDFNIFKDKKQNQ